MGRQHSVKRNSGRNSTLTERGNRALRRIVSKNRRTAAVHVTGKQNRIFILKTLFTQLHKSNVHGRAAIAKYLITESDALIRDRWCHNHKTWISYN
jgi:hypothetical protein